MINLSKFIAVLAAALALAACGGGGSTSTVAPVQVATSNLSVAVTPSITAALSNVPFAFAGGVPQLRTTGTTTIVFSGTGTTPAFTITSAAGTVTGFTTFGSCIFNVTGGTGLFQIGEIIRIDPCTFNVATAGFKIGDSGAANTSIVLGNTNSSPVQTSLNISDDGTVIFITGSGNRIPVGKVTFQLVTGS
jgi:hypothetical protein